MKFKRDIYTKIFFVCDRSFYNPTQLCICSDWTPNETDVPIELRVQVQQYLKHLHTNFKYRQRPNNLTPYQKYLLCTLLNDKQYIIVPADKNMGTCILEQ